MTNRIVDKLDILDDKIDKLCQWKERMETEWNAHTEKRKVIQENKNKNFYYVLGVIGVIVAIIEVVRSYT